MFIRLNKVLFEEAVPAEAPPATGGSEEPSDELTFEQVDELLNFNPFQKEQDTPSTEPESSAEEGTSVPAAEEVPPSEETGQPEVPDAPTAEATENALLRQKLDQMEQDLLAMRTPQAPAQPEGDNVPPYQFNIPKELMDHLQSDNPEEVRAGFGAVMTGVARATHQNVMNTVTQMLSSVVPQMVNHQVEQVNQAREIFEDFYGANPDLNVPSLRPVIVSAAQQVATEYRLNGWSQQLRDETARRVRTILATGQPRQATPPPPAPAGNGSGIRSEVDTRSPTAVDINRTLFGG